MYEWFLESGFREKDLIMIGLKFHKTTHNSMQNRDTVYGDMHCKDLQVSISRVGYCIPVQDFYLVLL